MQTVAAETQSLDQFMSTLKQDMQRTYDRQVNKDLSQQNWEELFIRNVVTVLRQGLKSSLATLSSLDTKPEQHEVFNSFNGFIDDFIQFALTKHRTSCALSNFATEHQPDQEYIARTLHEADLEWRAFSSVLRNILD